MPAPNIKSKWGFKIKSSTIAPRYVKDGNGGGSFSVLDDGSISGNGDENSTASGFGLVTISSKSHYDVKGNYDKVTGKVTLLLFSNSVTQGQINISGSVNIGISESETMNEPTGSGKVNADLPGFSTLGNFIFGSGGIKGKFTVDSPQGEYSVNSSQNTPMPRSPPLSFTLPLEVGSSASIHRILGPNSNYDVLLTLEPDQPQPCALTQFTASNFIGKRVVADIEFVNSLNTINDLAVQNNVEVYVTDSFREAGQTVSGAIVPPASNSNHLAGHAIDMNVSYAGTLYNSNDLRLANLSNLPDPVKDFINDIRNEPGLRWGGDFHNEDPVHIDDDLNANMALWTSRYDATQEARKSGCG